MPHLEIRKEHRERVRYHVINGAAVTIGRSSRADVVLHDYAVSRMHCVLEATDDGHVVRDLESHYGITVNAQPVTEAAIREGDRIRIGPYELCFREADQPALPSYDFDEHDLSHETGGISASSGSVEAIDERLPLTPPVPPVMTAPALESETFERKAAETALLHTISALRTELESERARVEEAREEARARAREEQRVRDEEMAALRGECEGLRASAGALQRALDGHAEQSRQQAARLGELARERDEAAANCERVQAEFDETAARQRAVLEDHHAAHAALEQARDALQREKETLAQANAVLTEELERLSASEAARVAMEAESHREAAEHLAAVEARLAASESAAREAAERIRALEEEHAHLHTRLREADQLLEQASEELASAAREREEFVNRLAESNQAREGLIREVETIEQARADLTARLAESERARESLHAAVEDREGAVAREAELAARNEAVVALERWLEEKEIEIRLLHETHAGEREQERIAHDAALAEARALTRRELDAALVEMREVKQRELETERADHAARLDALRAEIDTLIARQAADEARFVEQDAAMSVLRQAKEDLENQLIALREEASMYATALEALQSEGVVHAAAGVDSDPARDSADAETTRELREEVNALRDRLAAMSKRRDEALAEGESARAELLALRRRVGELERASSATRQPAEKRTTAGPARGGRSTVRAVGATGAGGVNGGSGVAGGSGGGDGLVVTGELEVTEEEYASLASGRAILDVRESDENDEGAAASMDDGADSDGDPRARGWEAESDSNGERAAMSNIFKGEDERSWKSGVDRDWALWLVGGLVVMAVLAIGAVVVRKMLLG